MKLYHNFGVDDDDDWEDYLFVIDDDNKKRKRIDEWDDDVNKLLHKKRFHKEYRMSHAAFTYLCIILHPSLERNYQKRRNGGPITVEMTVACGLQVLVGGTQDDMTHMFGISKTEVHATFRRFLLAVNEVIELDIVLPPKTFDEWNPVRMGFKKKNYCGLFDGCCGAIDGFFQPTTCPTVKEVGGNVTAYYSRCYESYGLKCQAACDVNLQFLFFSFHYILYCNVSQF